MKSVAILTAIGIMVSPSMGQPTIGEYVRNGESLTILFTALERTGLHTLLEDPGSFTLFAPNDTVVPSTAHQRLMKRLQPLLFNEHNDPTKKEPFLPHLKELLLGHLILNRSVSGAEFLGEDVFVLGNGQNISYSSISSNNPDAATLLPGSLRASGAVIVDPDIEASNGVIHRINKLLDTPALNRTFATFECHGLNASYARDLYVHFNLETMLIADSGYTYFAPMNTAFESFAESVGTSMEIITGNLDMYGPVVSKLLRFHIAPSIHAVADKENGTLPTLLENEVISVQVNPTIALEANENVPHAPSVEVRVGDATILASDIYVYDGVVHVLDQVVISAEVKAMFMAMSNTSSSMDNDESQDPSVDDEPSSDKNDPDMPPQDTSSATGSGSIFTVMMAGSWLLQLLQ